MNKFRLCYFMLAFLLVISSLPSSVYSQDATATPTASTAPITIQSADNRGLVTPMTIDEVMKATGIEYFRNNKRDGFGIRIGVIDAAFGSLDTFEKASGKNVSIPGEAKKSDYSNSLVTHGTDALEIIHTIAPEAKLYACQYNSFETFKRCIDYMLQQPVNIINHSAGVPILPLDGTNTWAKEVQRAIDSNILWVNSAGNFARGFVQDQFTDNNNNNYHEFRGLGNRVSEEIRYRNPTGDYNGNIILSWKNSDPEPTDAIDLDLEIIDLSSGEIIASSEQRQTTENAANSSYEQVYLTTDKNFGVRVKYHSGTITTPVDMTLFIEFAQIQGAVIQGSVIAPADNPNVLTVGALQGVEVAPYSSRAKEIASRFRGSVNRAGWWS